MNAKDRLAALRAKVKPSVKPSKQTQPAGHHAKKPQAHKVLVQTKVVHAPNTAAPENPEHRRIETTRLPPVEHTATPEQLAAKQAYYAVTEIPSRDNLVPATFENAVKLVHAAGIAYLSLFVERMSIGYGGAVAILDALEKEGVVAPDEGLHFHTHTYRRVLHMEKEKK
jgi:uncharacterized protein involved in copper resistance